MVLFPTIKNDGEFLLKYNSVLTTKYHKLYTNYNKIYKLYTTKYNKLYFEVHINMDD